VIFIILLSRCAVNAGLIIAHQVQLGRQKVVYRKNDHFWICSHYKFIFIRISAKLQPQKFGSVIIGRAQVVKWVSPQLLAGVGPLREDEPEVGVNGQDALLTFPHAVGLHLAEVPGRGQCPLD
jgi:hypothetical protein